MGAKKVTEEEARLAAGDWARIRGGSLSGDATPVRHPNTQELENWCLQPCEWKKLMAPCEQELFSV